MQTVQRQDLVADLKSGDFDLLVIGGGATGAGIALDAATRGLKTALVERDDFSSGTSSKSTKLIHGGVRYLEQAVLKFDTSQFNLVRDALRERSTLLKIAPHLAHPLPILTPLYNRIDVPYYRTGLKLYDRLAGRATLHKSYFVGTKEAMQKFPMLKSENLRGGVIYYDGQFDDSRMNIAIALTAIEHGAKVANHIEVTGLVRHKTKLVGARVKDRMTNEEWEIKARAIVNATGPFSDAIRKMDNPKMAPMLTASSGTHIMLGPEFSPPQTGLLIPKTEDGRVLFLLPWLGHTLVGTTDNPAKIVDQPKPDKDDVDYILRQLERYFTLKVKKSDILAVWTGLRPLVSDPRAVDTARLSRDHIIQISDSGLITIAGGKWTTYRKMAEDTVDQVAGMIENIFVRPSCTSQLVLRGGRDFAPEAWKSLMIDFKIDEPTARYFHRAYGTEAPDVLKLCSQHLATKLHPRHPFLLGEVRYAIEAELAQTLVDMLARRIRLTFLDKAATKECASRVADIMAEYLNWNAARKRSELEQLKKYL